MKNSWVSVFVFGVLISGGQAMAADAPLADWHKLNHSADCTAESKDADSFVTTDVKSGARNLPGDKYNHAIQILNGIQFPTAADLKAVKSEVDKKVEEGYGNYLQVVNSDCPVLRLKVGQALAGYSQTTGAKRAEIEKALRGLVTSTKFPTLMEVGVDANVIEAGLNANLWKADSKVKTQVASLLRDYRKSTKDWQKKYAPALATLSNSAGSLKIPEDKMAKVRAAFDEEWTKSQKYFAQLQSIVKELH